MRNTLKTIKIKLFRIPLLNYLNNSYQASQYKKGVISTPPSGIKQKKIIETAKNYSLGNLVETGTYLGDMVNATKKIFKNISSIELSDSLAKKAKQRFAKYNHIHIWQGDSPDILPLILKDIDSPTLFWLDAHYSGGETARSTESGDTPIEKELDIIFKFWREGSVILIDDARLFIGKDNYPTLETLKKKLTSNDPRNEIEVSEDIIKIFKK